MRGFQLSRPFSEYADVVWDNCTQYEANKLEQKSNGGSTDRYGATRLVAFDSLRTETGREMLASGRQRHKLLLLFKMKAGLSPYLSLLVPLIGTNSVYNLRNANKIDTVLVRDLPIYYNSFLPSVIRSWNELPQETRDSVSIASFKRHLNVDIRPPPPHTHTYPHLTPPPLSLSFSLSPAPNPSLIVTMQASV